MLVNKTDLINEIAKRTNLNKTTATDVINALTDTIMQTLKKGEKVTLMGFGTWEVRKREARTGRNPQTGAPIKIKARRVPRFNAGKDLRKAVSNN